MEYRLAKQGLLERLNTWDYFLKKKVHLIACGGTALTLLGIKPSTKDIDLIVPDISEYRYLIDILKQLGYKPATGWGWARGDGFIFDLFKGKAVHTTGLIESPLERGNHILIKEFSNIYLGALNFYDIIITKLFRATTIDIEDCLSLIRDKKDNIDMDELIARFQKTASFDISKDKVNKNFNHFLRLLKKEGLYNEK